MLFQVEVHARKPFIDYICYTCHAFQFWFKPIFILLVIFEIAYLSNIAVNNIDAVTAADVSQKSI